MIRNISLQHFKCFNDVQSFECGPINLYMGANGLGKSSLFQSLLLLCQSVHKNKDIDPLCLNGEFVNLDKFADILYSDDNYTAKNFSINLEFDSKNPVKSLFLKYTKQQARTGKLLDIKINGESKIYNLQGVGINVDPLTKGNKVAIYKKEEISNLFSKASYISAHRHGPTRREIVDDSFSVNCVGKNGEHRLNVLTDLKNKYSLPVSQTKVSLKNAVNYWMNEIMNGTTINVSGIENDDADVLTLRILNTRNHKVKGFKAINSGFGFSYILSVIESILLSPQNGLVFIENPEAHLHPAAQSRFAKLVLWAAKNDRQVFIETHSEHILDGLRVFVTKDEKLQQTDLCIHYFNMDGTITQIHMDKYGFLEESAPAGFCDQATINSLELFRLKFLQDQIHED